MPRFSLIVPVYRVEEYLPKCVDSVRAQECQDFELLLVDDGSPDRCPALCDAYAAEDPQHIRVIHQENAGPGAARNRGIDEARGDYLVFLDSDDYLSPETLAELSKAIDDYSIAIRIDSNLAEAYYNRGIARSKSGNKQAAIQDLSKAGELGLYDAYAVIKRLNKQK